MMLHKLRAPLKKRIPQLTLLLILLQPCLDVLSFWLGKFSAGSTMTLLLRLMLLALTVLVGFCLAEKKWVYYAMFGLCAAFFAAHGIACAMNGYQDMVGDFTNFVRIAQMPVTTLCLITFLKANAESFEGLQKGLTASLLLILLVMVLATVTGTDPHTYTLGRGVLGWFQNTNSQSNNLCVLLAISLTWQLCRKESGHILFGVTALGGFAALFLLAPRLAYVGGMVIAAGLCITLCIVCRKKWKTALLFALICVLLVVLIPVSPMGRYVSNENEYRGNQTDKVLELLGDEQEEIVLLAQRQRTAKDLTEAEHQRLVTALTPVYEKYVGDFVSQFGVEETMELYDYAIDFTAFTALRAKKLMFAQALMENSHPLSRWFGLELSRFTVDGTIYDVENDFHGIYYLCGAVGLGLYLAFLLYFVGLILWALFKNAKRYFTLQAAGYGIALILCLAHAYATSGVLRRPNASIYLSAILAGIYYLVKLKQYEEA